MAAGLCLNGLFGEPFCRIRGGIPEMPGSVATAPQARCLFGLDAETGDAVLAALVDAKFLSRPPTASSRLPAIQAP